MKGVALALVAAAAVAATTVGASTAGAAQGAACSHAAANAAIRQVKPRIPSLGDTPLLVTPKDADGLICFDFTRDGRTDLAVTVASGGTAGDIGWFVLVRTRTGWRLAIGRAGYKVGIFRVGGDLVDSQPVYRKHDPNCCPTGGFDHERWHWNGSRFARTRAWHSKSFHP